MNILEAKVEAFMVDQVAGLDPILVMTQDISDGKGRLIVSCYGQAWACYWGAMGAGNTVAKFVATAPEGYVADKLFSGEGLLRSAEKVQKRYLERIVDAVTGAFRLRLAAGQLSKASGDGESAVPA